MHYPDIPKPISIRRLKYSRTYEVALEKAGLGPVAGVDEAGRGACAGPLTVAACVLPARPISELSTLTDSKKLSAKQRETLFPLIIKHSLAWSVIVISAAEIDAKGIQWANLGGMRRAVAKLEIRPGFVLSDGFAIPGLPITQLPIIGGDATARCIAAASVLAKVTRDRIMGDLDTLYPKYGLAVHKGYGTAAHQQALEKYGATDIHRHSYANIARAQKIWGGASPRS
ncbi:ribonuclease HII [Corynebacterium caspium]|uniref:ribonuclease HII n=1 Tax=Corynebacterium caspium TaxID=234828 RepID=UPI0003669D8E|nr:ribonuclease HII [Corynebacterium caspium]WKD59060.1 Ribonuclease HII [Corynebacterium caspium DSM 44850]